MHPSTLELNLLAYLDALLTDRSVSKAANRMFITQPAMSLALARIRDYFKDELLVRTGRTMSLTPLALSLVQPVHDVLLQVQSIASSTVQFDPAKSDRKISVMASDFTLDLFLKRAIPLLAQLAPEMRLEFRALTSNFQEDFERGNIDFLIIAAGYMSEGHPSELLCKEKYTCVVWSKNTVVKKQLTLDQYRKMGHVRVNLGEWRVPTYEEWFVKRYGNIRRIEVEVPSFGAAIQTVTGTQRIATCHLRHAKMYAKQYALRIVKPPFAIPPVEIRIQWHKYMDRDPALVWFRALLKEIAAGV